MSGKEIVRYTINGIVYKVFGEYDMFPDVDESGRRLNTGYDFYDVYTLSKDGKYLTCVNDGRPFRTEPTETDIKNHLNNEKA